MKNRHFYSLHLFFFSFLNDILFLRKYIIAYIHTHMHLCDIKDFVGSPEVHKGRA